MPGQSEACCNVPAIVGHDYKAKGTYTQVADMKTYATGPSTAKKGILVIYDIFGFFPQTLQGADILAYSDSEQPYQVFIPDFFDGKPADISWYPPDNKEKEEKLGAFFNNAAAPPKTLKRIPTVVDELTEKHGITEWGILGYCWGGKIANMVSTEKNRFNTAAVAHPASVDAKDAASLTIPFALIASGDESAEDVENWKKAIKVKNIVERFEDQIHGFMAARSDLSQEKVKEAYEKGYKLLLQWFRDTL